MSITLDNAVNLILGSRSVSEINRILDEVARLTYTKIKDIHNNLFSAERMQNAGGNPLMIKAMSVAEACKLEITK